jgi:DNA-binding response OmpR family regulator
MVLSAAAKRLHAVRVLVVEDDADSRESVVEYLMMEGADVSCASTGSEGFGAFVLTRPKVIVSDLCIPDGDGYQLIKRVRELPAVWGGLTAAVAVSSAANRIRALAAGFNEFLAKPLDLNELTEKLAKLAARS